ncbi:MAG TPA: glycosyltransferase family 2 protein [Pirellulales bacterium]|nr:glycosyltransferase family 2 protein [Pirellulales bacterium]
MENDAAEVMASKGVPLTVLMPCLNEERTVGRCVLKAVAEMARLRITGEVLVVDNGSNDASVAVARASGARVVVERRRGYGAALRRGFREARFEYVVFGDCDESYDFNEVGRFVERLRSGADLVIGNRFAGGVLPGAMPWLHRRIGNPLLSFLVNAMYRVGVGDSQSGMRGMSKTALRAMNLRMSGMELASEMLIKASLAGLRIEEIPIILAPDGRDRPPHLRSFRDGWRHLRLMLMLSPLHLFLLPGLLVALIGVCVIPLLLFAGYGQHDGMFGPNLMFTASILSICGSQVALLGVLAKMHAAAMDPVFEDRRLGRLTAALSVERGLVTGVALLTAAAFCGLPVLARYASSLEVSSPGLWILACTLFVLAVETLFGSFLISIFDMHRRDDDQPQLEGANASID